MEQDAIRQTNKADDGLVQVATRIPPDWHARLKERADAEERSVAWEVRRLIRESIEAEAEQAAA
jgi:plasmid stability protein